MENKRKVKETILDKKQYYKNQVKELMNAKALKLIQDRKEKGIC